MADDPLRQLRLEIGRSRRRIDRRFRDATDGVRLIFSLRKQWRQASWSRLWTSFALGLFNAFDVRKYWFVQVLRNKLEQWPSRGIWSDLWKEVAAQEPALAPPTEQPAPSDDAEERPAPGSNKSKESP